MLVLHRAKLLASNQSVLALGVAPMRVVSRWCRCVVQRLCATDCKHPCLVRAAAPHSAPARTPGVYAQMLYARTHTSGRTKSVQDAPTINDHDCTMQSKKSIHSPSPWGRGLGIRQGCRDRTPKGFARMQSPQSVLKGIESLLYFYKNRLFCLLIFYFAYSPCRLSFFVLK